MVLIKNIVVKNELIVRTNMHDIHKLSDKILVSQVFRKMLLQYGKKLVKKNSDTLLGNYESKGCLFMF